MQISGNEKNLSFLKESAESGRLSHAYIISGPKGSGKKTFAYNAAASLLCMKASSLKSLSYCGLCPACKKALSGNHPDIIRITHEKKNVLSVEEIRTQIIQNIDIKPYYGPYKIYIIEDANLMLAQAQNALLKTIEEPPSYALLFLLTENADSFPETINSRCIRLNMQPLEDSFIENELILSGTEKTAAEKFAAFSAGNYGRAKELSQNEEAAGALDYIINLLSEINKMDALEISSAAAFLSENEDFDITDTFRKWFRDILVLKSSAKGKLYFPGCKKTLLSISERMSYENINNTFLSLDEADERIKFHVNSKAAYEALLLRIRQNG